MKTHKYIYPVSGFLAGIVSGISIIVLFAFTNSPVPPGSGNSPISAAEANTCFKNYMATAASLNQVIKGFTVDKSQLDAMNSIISENAQLTGFRIYFGKDVGGQKSAIVVGVDSFGHDAVSNTIYHTSAPNNNPCPPVCDLNSAIIKN
jgi:hypothetical protein